MGQRLNRDVFRVRIGHFGNLRPRDETPSLQPGTVSVEPRPIGADIHELDERLGGEDGLGSGRVTGLLLSGVDRSALRP